MSVSCDRIIRNLRRQNVEIDVAHFSPRHLRWNTEKKINGKQFSCPVRADISHTLNRFWSLIENENYSHIVAFGGLLPMNSAPIYSKWLNASLITMIRGNDFDTGIFSLKRSDILRNTLKNSNSICAVSKNKVKKISTVFPQAKVFWTPNGIDFQDWEFSAEDKAFAIKWRKENEVEDKKVIGLFGQLKRKKGGLFFLENLLRSGVAEKFHLLFIGDMEEEMKIWLEENAEKISFSQMSFLDRYELLPFYATCDFIAIPSFYDGMPNVLLESAALGIPIIASNVDGMQDILTNEKDSILFKAGDDFDCRKAIQKTAKIDSESMQTLKENIYKTAKIYSPKNETKQFLKVFQQTNNSNKKGVANA